MRRLRAFLLRLAATLRGRGRRERELADELESHLQLHIDECVRRGMSPEAARREAVLALGGVEATKEDVRAQSRLSGIESVWQDIRFAARALRRNPGYAVVVIATFALGIGANAAIFSAVNTVLLQPLPFPDADRLVALWNTDRRAQDGWMPVAPADFTDWQERSRSYTGLATSCDAIYSLTGDGEPEMLIGYLFSPEMFPLLGVAPALGRTFGKDDPDNVVVLGDRLWRRRFHADPGVVGRTIQLDHEAYTVLGVMPPQFRQPKNVELWAPLSLKPTTKLSRERTILRIVGRLRPGVTVEEARTELRGIAAALAREHPETDGDRGADVVSMRTMQSGDARTALLVLSGAVGFVLLLGCANVAGLSLARAAARRREIGIRAAVGAGRGRIVRQLLTESLLLAFAGAAVGLVLAGWTSGILVDFFPKNVANVNMPIVERLPLDSTVILFTTGAALLAGVVAGLLPALQASRTDLAEILGEGARGTPRGSRLRPVLVVGQIGLAIVLCAGAGLLVRSAQLRARALGFQPANVLTARVILDRSRHAEPEERRQMLDGLLARLRAAPGVTAAGAVTFVPFSGWSSNATFRDGDHPTEEHEAGYLIVDPGYFQALGIPVVRGRGFGPVDGPSAPRTMLVDGRFVRRFLGDRDPVGARFDFGTPDKPDRREIIGVVGDVEIDPPPDKPRPMVYGSFAQDPWPIWGLVVRSAGDPVAVAGALRDAVWSLDADQPVAYVLTLDELVGDALALHRTSTWLIAFFAGLALVLAAMGVYGVFAQSVLERRHEIGIRLALGARPQQILRPMLGRLLRMVACGLAVGVPGALAGGRLLGALIYGVSPGEPALLAGVAGLLAAVALAAAYLPLRRALRTDPSIALREA